MTTEKLRRVYTSAPADEVIIETLQLSHSKFSRTWYLTSNAGQFSTSTYTAGTPPVAFSATLETRATVDFTPLPFTVKLPNSDAQGGQLLDIAIANAGQDMVAEIEAAATDPSERIEVVYRVYLESDKTAPQNMPIKLSLDYISMNDEVIQAQAGRSDVLNFRFPTAIYQSTGPNAFPGLDR